MKYLLSLFIAVILIAPTGLIAHATGCFDPTDCAPNQTCDTSISTCVPGTNPSTGITTNSDGTINQPTGSTNNSSGGTSLANYDPSTGLPGLINFAVNVVNAAVPVIFAIAFLVFIWGVFQAFILNGANEEKRAEGMKFVTYGVVGFVIMLSLWGLVSLVRVTLGLNSTSTAPSYPTLPKPTS